MKVDLEKLICSLFKQVDKTGYKLRLSNFIKALKEQGLEYKDGKLTQIESEPETAPAEDSEYDPYSLPVWDESNLPRMDESKYHPCTEKKDKPETEEKAYFKKAIADIVDYSRKHPDITPDGFVDRFMEHLLDIARLALQSI